MTLTTTLVHLVREQALLSVKDASLLMGMTPWWIRQLIATGELRAINVGGHETSARWRIDPEDIQALLKRRESRARDLVA